MQSDAEQPLRDEDMETVDPAVGKRGGQDQDVQDADTTDEGDDADVQDADTTDQSDDADVQDADSGDTRDS